jgi:hypothetical protein
VSEVDDACGTLRLELRARGVDVDEHELEAIGGRLPAQSGDDSLRAFANRPEHDDR